MLVVVMTVLFSSGWTGMAYIEDMDRGVMDKFLSSPVSRGAMMASSTVNQAVSTVIQSLVIVAVGILAGARYDGGVPGVLVMLLAAVLLAGSFSALSNGMALIVRTREALIGFSTMLTLPLSGVSCPVIRRNSVDLPAPFGPMTPTMPPGGSVKDRSSKSNLSP